MDGSTAHTTEAVRIFETVSNLLSFCVVVAKLRLGFAPENLLTPASTSLTNVELRSTRKVRLARIGAAIHSLTLHDSAWINIAVRMGLAMQLKRRSLPSPRKELDSDVHPGAGGGPTAERKENLTFSCTLQNVMEMCRKWLGVDHLNPIAQQGFG